MSKSLPSSLTNYRFLFSGLIIVILCYFGYENLAASGNLPSPLRNTVQTATTHQETTHQETAHQETAQTAHNLLDDTMNSTLGFEKIFIINLATRTDRRDAFTLASAFTGLDIEVIDAATTVDEKAWPPGPEWARPNAGGAGCWRSHMNVLREIVDRGLSSALILEDDADWDIRIKTQLRTFARASRILTQPLKGTTDQFLDPTYPQPGPHSEETKEFHLDQDSTISEPTTSPYGDLNHWDLLWFGHCGTRFPYKEDKTTPLARVIIPNDDTVPTKPHVDTEFGSRQFLDDYPEHTRVVSRAHGTVCTHAYGISQAGARRILYEIGLKAMRGPVDLEIRDACSGGGDMPQLTCFAPQPQLFAPHRPAGATARWSNISPEKDLPEGVVAKPFSTNLRWSTQANFDRLVEGRTDFVEYSKEIKAEGV